MSLAEATLARQLAACTKTWMREETADGFVYLRATLPDGRVADIAYSIAATHGNPTPEQLAADVDLRRRASISALSRKLAKHIIEASQ